VEKSSDMDNKHVLGRRASRIRRCEYRTRTRRRNRHIANIGEESEFILGLARIERMLERVLLNQKVLLAACKYDGTTKPGKTDAALKATKKTLKPEPRKDIEIG
jgi:hypothetical protein